jgi:hypothetical protein
MSNDSRDHDAVSADSSIAGSQLGRLPKPHAVDVVQVHAVEHGEVQGRQPRLTT